MQLKKGEICRFYSQITLDDAVLHELEKSFETSAGLKLPAGLTLTAAEKLVDKWQETTTERKEQGVVFILADRVVIFAQSRALTLQTELIDRALLNKYIVTLLLKSGQTISFFVNFKYPWLVQAAIERVVNGAHLPNKAAWRPWRAVLRKGEFI